MLFSFVFSSFIFFFSFTSLFFCTAPLWLMGFPSCHFQTTFLNLKNERRLMRSPSYPFVWASTLIVFFFCLARVVSKESGRLLLRRISLLMFSFVHVLLLLRHVVFLLYPNSCNDCAFIIELQQGLSVM
jgi:hypothetical protein